MDVGSLAARIEVHPIQTLTLTDTQFLRADASAGGEAVVAGALHLAQGKGRMPVVMLVHGSGGLNAGLDAWIRLFNAKGISAFALDGFSGRGLYSVNADQTRLGRLNMILDAYRALDILGRHPQVDSRRIVLMGFSRGGQAALYAAMRRFHASWNASGLPFAGYIAFYPDCSTRYLGDTGLAGPVRIHHGEADDYDPLAPAAAYAMRLREAGCDVRLTTYAGAHHAFDVPLLGTVPRLLREAVTVRHCDLRENGDGVLVNMRTGYPFSYQDADVERGAHVAHDPQATLEAQSAVLRELEAWFSSR